MQVPAAKDLVAEKFLRPPRTARGIYLDRSPKQDDVHMRFVWATPNKWVWMHAAEPLAGAITDGTTNVIIEDGVAVLVTEEGEGVVIAGEAEPMPQRIRCDRRRLTGPSRAPWNRYHTMPRPHVLASGRQGDSSVVGTC